MDVFDRIAAAIKLITSGTPTTDPAVQAHLTAIDQHLSTLDGQESDEATRLSNIEAGLNKVADAFPANAGTTTGGDAGTGTGTTTTGTGTDDGSAPVDAAGNPVNQG